MALTYSLILSLPPLGFHFTAVLAFTNFIIIVLFTIRKIFK